jgi:DNA-directed RNA polymerase subunit RPC12/RpoP
MPGIWAKSLKENKMLMHMQEHQMAFAAVISDGADLKAYTKNFSWSELGYDFQGMTEALVFESKIRKDRNPFMFDQYQKGFVRNHSVGMQYVKLTLCINDEECGAEYEAWQKYYPEVANKENADEKGYFWAVKEAKVVEGSSVVRGSNWATPTISISEGKNQPDTSTGKKEPETSTLKKNLNKSVLFRKLTVCDNCGTFFDSWGMEPEDDGMIECKACGGRTTKENSDQSNKGIDYSYLLNNLKL